MSVKVSNWVWQDCPLSVDGQSIRGNHFTVLLALADIADDDGNVIYAEADKRTRKALARKARMSESTWYRCTVLLERLHILEITQVGLMNRYRINMAAASESSTEVSTTGQVDLFITTGQFANVSHIDPHYRSAVTAQGTFNTDRTIGQVDNSRKEGGQVQSDDQDDPHLSWKTRRRLSKAQADLDVDALVGLVGTVFTSAGIDPVNLPRILALIGRRILLRPLLANTHVDRPTSYVAVAIRNEPEVWRKIAFELEAAA